MKKRVERSSEDPTTVITTYEGQHCHHTAGFPRGGIISHEATFSSHMTPPTSQFHYPGMRLPRENPPSTVVQSQPPLPVGAREGNTVHVPTPTPQLPTDEGLLGDIVPPGMRWSNWERYSFQPTNIAWSISTSPFPFLACMREVLVHEWHSSEITFHPKIKHEQERTGFSSLNSLVISHL